MNPDILSAITVAKNPGSTVTITGEIPFSELERHRSAALRSIGKNMEMQGFRKGHVPEKQLVARIGEMAVLTEMAELALREAYPVIVKEERLDVIGHPSVNITKLAPGNPLGFSATVAVMPDVPLPDYTKLAASINAKRESAEVTDADVDKQIEEIMRQKEAYEQFKKKQREHAHEHAHHEHEHEHDHSHDHTHHDHDHAHEHHEHGHEHHDHGHEDMGGDTETANLPLPELTDEYVKTLGTPGQFATVDDFKKKIREHLAEEKTRLAASAHRAKITDAIIEKTPIDVPEVMIEAETNQFFAQMENDLKAAGLTLESYFEHVKKSRADVKKEFAPAAKKRAMLQLILDEIAKKENIAPDKELVEREVAHVLERHKNADKTRVRIYVESILRNEAVMKRLESC